MLQTTTHSLDGKNLDYLGLASGEAIMGANVVRDVFARFTDFFGGRSGTYESKLREGRLIALREMNEEAAVKGADAVIGIDLDYEVIGRGGSMLMVVATGTAVKII